MDETREGEDEQEEEVSLDEWVLGDEERRAARANGYSGETSSDFSVSFSFSFSFSVDCFKSGRSSPLLDSALDSVTSS